MSKTYQIEIAPDGISVNAEAGANLRDVLAQHSIVLTAPCGGEGTCGKCRVIVAESGSDAGERLACQYSIHSDISVTVPSVSRIAVLADSSLASDAIKTALSVELAPFAEGEKPAKRGATSRILGLAVDLGTTTVSASLIDLESGQSLGFATVINQQIRFGADVITRIGYTQKGEAFRRDLSQALSESVRLVSETLLSQTGLGFTDICRAVFAGNTTMFATLLERDCEPLITPPYSAPFTESLALMPQDAEALGEIGFSARTRLDFLPAIGGYVGSDILSGLLIATMRRTEAPFVFLDIGTNGEAVVVHGGKFVASSAAAGPAFEGGEISCGMPAMSGAIHHVGYENCRIAFRVIGDGSPIGICGSGLIDACASLVRSGAIEPSGRFCDDISSLPAQGACGRRRKDDQAAFYLDENVWVTQEDIRKTQLAKGAIRTCIEFLLDEARVEPGSVKRVLLGGAFGSFVDPRSAEAIGLIPTFANATMESLGNTSLAGAIAVLLARQKLDEMRHLQSKTRYVNLAGRPEFEERFAANLAFPAAK